MRAALFSASILLLAACNGATPSAGEETPQQQAGAGAPVDTGPPNNREAKPAFPEQTRAPERKSGVAPKVTKVADFDRPWAVALLPDGALLVTEQESAKLWLMKPDGAKSEIGGLPNVRSGGQGGLMDVSVAPDFATSGLVYLTFSEQRDQGKNTTSLARGKLNAERNRLSEVAIIFRLEPAWDSGGHFGSNIEWAPDGNLYVTLGERQQSSSRRFAQDINTHIGKVVRLKPDGTAADGNPYLGRTDARPEVWSYGHRNPQGAAIHPDSGKLWTIEHGPRGGDEINIPEAGKNYGWPIICYCIDYSGGPIGEGIWAKEGMEQPVYYFDPVIAPGDMTFYRGDLFPWKGNILASALSGGIVRLELNGEKVVGEERLIDNAGRIRDIQEAADGSLWIAVNEGNGGVFKVTPR